MGWMLEFIGVVCGAAVVPITLALISARVTPLYMIISAPVSTIAGVAAWLGTTKGMFGTIDITTTFDNWSMFAGCITSLCLPMVIWLVMLPFTPSYDWDRLFCMEALEPRPGDAVRQRGDESDLGADWDAVALRAAGVRAKWISGVLCLIFLVIIPFSLYGSGYVFSRGFFTGWMVIVFLWSWTAALLIWCLPIWESRKQLWKVISGVATLRKPVLTGAETPSLDGHEQVTDTKVQ